MPVVRLLCCNSGDYSVRRFSIVAATQVAIAGFAGVASAADLPARVYTKAPPVVAPLYDWHGFFIGLNGGGGWSHNCWNLTAVAAGLIRTVPSEGCSDPAGGLAGGQFGYRWQMANWVFGVEAQGDWANLKGSSISLTGTFGGLPFLNQTRIDAIGLFTAQVGYAWNNVFAYVKGGAAVTRDRYNGVTKFVTPPFGVGYAFDGASETRWGGAAGAGVEYGFAPGWSVALEYDHLFMDSSSNRLVTPAGVFDRTERVQQDVDIATIRLNYTFAVPTAQ